MFRFLYETIFRESPVPIKVTCYLILLLRYVGSMSYVMELDIILHVFLVLILCVCVCRSRCDIQLHHTRNKTCFQHTSTVISDNK